jgi:ribosomal protein S17E
LHFWIGSFCGVLDNGRPRYPRGVIAIYDVITLIEDIGNQIPDKIMDALSQKYSTNKRHLLRKEYQYVLAFSADRVEDIIQRYTLQWDSVQRRRKANKKSVTDFAEIYSKMYNCQREDRLITYLLRVQLLLSLHYMIFITLSRITI